MYLHLQKIQKQAFSKSPSQKKEYETERERHEQGVPVTSDISKETGARIEGRSEHRGVLRDVLWEGLPGSVRRRLVREKKVPLADIVHMIEWRGGPKADLMIAAVALGIVFFTLALIMGIVLFVRGRNR